MNPILHHRDWLLKLICAIALAMISMETVGCQSLMENRAKQKAAKAAKERFSCGESLPSRNP